MTTSPRRSLRDRHTEETRRSLLSAGRRLFGDRGFAGTSVDAIATEAGVTTGALYHHFPNKTRLFDAVFEELEQELCDRSNEAATGHPGDPLAALTAGLEAFLDAALEPVVQRVVLVDAPSALGIERFQEIEEIYGYGALLAGVNAARRAGALRVDDPETTAHILLGALTSAAVLIARAEDPPATRARVGHALRELLAGLAP